MAIVIHLEPQLHKCLHKLYKAGGRAALAAERVAGPVGAQDLVARRIDPAAERIVEGLEGAQDPRCPSGRQATLGLGRQ